jgi:hypothetical protein
MKTEKKTIINNVKTTTTRQKKTRFLPFKRIFPPKGEEINHHNQEKPMQD